MIHTKRVLFFERLAHFDYRSVAVSTERFFVCRANADEKIVSGFLQCLKS